MVYNTPSSNTGANVFDIWFDKKEPAQFIVGDVDGTGIVDVDDVNALINIILDKKSTIDYPGVADVDGSGIVDVDDVNAVINIILGS